MVQILWKSNAPHSPMKDHDLVELRLVDLGSNASRRYLVREIRAGWSASEQKIEWKGYKDRVYRTSREAETSFEIRKAHMSDAGYSYTTTLG